MEISAETLGYKNGISALETDSPMLHQSFTEQGKLYFLEGNFDLALKYFRYSLELAVQTESPQFLIKHYMECLLEALEMTENYAAVITYCDRVIGLLEDEDKNLEKCVYLAQAYQKKGIILLKSGKGLESKNLLEASLSMAKSNKFPMPLAENILFLINSGITPNKERIFEEQQQAGYFFINPENTNKAIALKIEN